MARRFTRPFMYDFIGRSNRALWGSQKPQKNQDTAQSFQRTLQVGHCLIASGPADLSVGFCTVAIVTPLRTPAHLRAYPRRHRRGQETRANTGPTAARPGDGFRRPETHRDRIVTRWSRKTAWHWQGNGLQNRKGAALKSKPRPFGPLE